MNEENDKTQGGAPDKRRAASIAPFVGNEGRRGLDASDPMAAAAHRILSQVPGRRAPVTLAPRVFAEITRRAKLAWYRRPWTDWPEALRWFSTMVLAGIVAGALRLLEGSLTNPSQSSALAAMQEVPAYVDAIEASGRALVGITQALPSTWLTAFVLAAFGTAACGLGLGTAAWRLAKSPSA